MLRKIVGKSGYQIGNLIQFGDAGLDLFAVKILFSSFFLYMPIHILIIVVRVM